MLAIAAAWLVGLALATTGSFLAVNALAHGLLRQPAQQLLGTTAMQDIDPTPSPQSSPLPADGDAPDETKQQASTSPAAVPVTSAAPQAAGGTLLTSPGGSVMASCQPGGAYLQYWIPAQGFEAGDVIRGPAALARIQFEHLTTEVTMTVSCSSGTPVAHVTGG